MPETLLSPSNLILYGILVTDLQVGHQPPPPPPPPPEADLHRPSPPGARNSANRFLDQQLERVDAQFARIYGFSFEGHYYDLPRPLIFLVHGPGVPAEDVKPGNRASRGPAQLDRAGTGAQGYSFADNMMMWSYDKGDFSIRLDVETGPLEQILLEAMLRTDTSRSYYSGAEARLSGAEARLSGAEARSRNRRGGWTD
jgi:hypothetical protein